MGKGKGKAGSRVRNDARPCGKGWKQGKSPEVRAAEAAAKRARKAA